MSFLKWPTSTVLEKLKALKLDKYSSSFQSNDISGAVLPLLTESHLKELGMTLVGHRLKLLRYVIMLQRGVDILSSTDKPLSSSIKSSTPASSNSQNNGGNSSQSSARSQSSTNKPEETVVSKPTAAPKPAPAPTQAPKPAAPQKKAAPAYDDSGDNYNGNDDDDDDGGYSTPPPTQTTKKPKGNGGGANSNPLRTSVRRNAPSPKAPPPPADDGNDDRVECAYCHRRFASDRISKHEEVCGRMSSKKKKVFDAKKMRLDGTEAAQYQSKSSKAAEPQKKPSKYKQEHAKLVESLRAARKYQAYEKAKEEGKAVGPPPELPKYEIIDDDRVTCPNCGRKFGAEAAQRHIAVCERMNNGGGGGGRMRTSPAKRGGRR